MTPIIGITTDITDPGGGKPLRLDCSLAYARCVTAAGAVPVLLPPILDSIHEHLRFCDGFIFTGGDDPRTEAFGVPTHPAAKPVHPDRQKYELTLLELLRNRRPGAPVLGVCLGMQMMTLHAGGSLIQHLPEILPSAAQHRGTHDVVPSTSGSAGVDARTLPVSLPRGPVASNHHQAVGNAGPMVVLAKSPDDVIEAIADLKRRFYVGVQWHPERTPEPALGQSIFSALVNATRR